MRRAISKLRTSSHKLEIETGRWNNIPRDQRICKNCTMDKVEDENHLLFECQMHQAARREFFESLKQKMNMDLSLSTNPREILQHIFRFEDLGVLNALGKFTKNALQKRENTICYILPPHYVFYQTT